jgi:hypothetical protein
MRNHIDPRLCDILQEGLTTYFKGESTTNVHETMENTTETILNQKKTKGSDTICQNTKKEEKKSRKRKR